MYDKRKNMQEREALTKQLRAILDVAESEHREMTDSEMRDYNVLDAKLDQNYAEARRNDILAAAEESVRYAFSSASPELASAFPPDCPHDHSDRTIIRDAAGREYRALTAKDPLVPVTRNEMRNFDLGIAVRGIVTGDWPRGCIEQRLISESGNPNIIPAPISGRVIDLARAKSVCIESGAQVIAMDSATLRLPTVTADVTAAWRDEGDAVNVSDPSLSALTLTAKSLGCLTWINNELLDDCPLLSRILSQIIPTALGKALDYACLVGDGTSHAPVGIANFSNVLHKDLNGATPTASEAANAIWLLADENADLTNLTAVWNVASGAIVDAWKDGNSCPDLGTPAYQACKKAVTSSFTAAADDICGIIGDFSQLVIGMRMNPVIEISRSSTDGTYGYHKNQTGIRCILRADCGGMHEKHFCKILPSGE